MDLDGVSFKKVEESSSITQSGLNCSGILSKSTYMGATSFIKAILADFWSRRLWDVCIKCMDQCNGCHKEGAQV